MGRTTPADQGNVLLLKNREWYITSYAPDGVPSSDHLELRSSELSLGDIPDGHFVVEALFVSVDPFLRSRMTGREDGLYTPQYQLGQVPLILIQSISASACACFFVFFWVCKLVAVLTGDNCIWDWKSSNV